MGCVPCRHWLRPLPHRALHVAPRGAGPFMCGPPRQARGQLRACCAGPCAQVGQRSRTFRIGVYGAHLSKGRSVIGPCLSPSDAAAHSAVGTATQIVLPPPMAWLILRLCGKQGVHRSDLSGRDGRRMRMRDRAHGRRAHMPPFPARPPGGGAETSRDCAAAYVRHGAAQSKLRRSLACRGSARRSVAGNCGAQRVRAGLLGKQRLVVLYAIVATCTRQPVGRSTNVRPAKLC